MVQMNKKQTEQPAPLSYQELPGREAASGPTDPPDLLDCNEMAMCSCAGLGI
jgi:hypothetical protein